MICMKHIIIDTNVPVKAADIHPKEEVDRKCSQACLSFIKTLMDSEEVVVLDKGREIIKEYHNNINLNAEDNVASEFLKWVIHAMLLGKRVTQYQITKVGNSTYAEFPTTPALASFDRSDRKFVALAKADPENPSIYNGSDTDWWDYKEALRNEGIRIVFLCEEYMCKKSRGRS